MKTMQNGEFFGIQDKKLELANTTLTYTTYTHAKVDWHQHENAYFTFLLTGKMAEINRKGRQDCTPGSLLFHNSDEAHYNLKPRDHTRGFHVELKPEWPAEPVRKTGEGSYAIHDPRRKLIIFEIFREFLTEDPHQAVAIDALVRALVQETGPVITATGKTPPQWVRTVRELINDLPGHDWTLDALSIAAGVHPNHLSRAFPAYFGCTLGRYLRAARVQRALTLMVSSDFNLSEIAQACGFADQSHFIRTFRSFHRLTPLAYRKQLAAG